jgi:hypothetical protein
VVDVKVVLVKFDGGCARRGWGEVWYFRGVSSAYWDRWSLRELERVYNECAVFLCKKCGVCLRTVEPRSICKGPPRCHGLALVLHQSTSYNTFLPLIP